MTSDAANTDRLAQLRAENALIVGAMRAAVREALLVHKRAGQPVVTWDNGRVVWIPASEICTDDSAEIH